MKDGKALVPDSEKARGVSLGAKETQVQRITQGVCICVCVSGVGAMTWSPLACGIISGKYDSGVPAFSRASLKVLFPIGLFVPPCFWCFRLGFFLQCFAASYGGSLRRWCSNGCVRVSSRF